MSTGRPAGRAVLGRALPGGGAHCGRRRLRSARWLLPSRGPHLVRRGPGVRAPFRALQQQQVVCKGRELLCGHRGVLRALHQARSARRRVRHRRGGDGDPRRRVRVQPTATRAAGCGCSLLRGHPALGNELLLLLLCGGGLLPPPPPPVFWRHVMRTGVFLPQEKECDFISCDDFSSFRIRFSGFHV